MFDSKMLIVVLLIALVIFGTKRLRSIGSDLGAAVKGFKSAMNEGETEEAAKQLKQDKDADFGVGFSEILLTSAIALIVLGPEKLPKVARQVGNWVGRARAMARQLSEQLEREVSAEELLKATNSNNAAKAAATTSAEPAPFDTSYTPNAPSTAAAPDAVASPPDAATPPSDAAPPAAHAATPAYSPETATTVHGADWHPSPTPPENKAANE
jgi:Tat protein translocase TatB subunit